MHPWTANENSRLLFWSSVREFAVPPAMIESATARRAVGDWAGACAAAHVDVDLNLRTAGRVHGREFAAQVRADLRHLAPDLLRWHFPRIGPIGLLRPGLTVSLARYPPATHLVARTPPAWADAGQRISLALWDPSLPRNGAGLHPHPRPDRRFRLDLHRHLWDVRRAGELAQRSGSGRWAAEAALLLHADGHTSGVVAVRLGTGRFLALDLRASDGVVAAIASARAGALPLLPDAATWIPPDLELLRAGLIDAERLHPLVASALGLGHRIIGPARSPDVAGNPRLVECRGARHRIGVVDGVLRPLDHDRDEIRREELLGALGGPMLPCLRAIDEAQPESLGLLGPDVLRRGEEFETAVRRRVTHGLYRAGLAGLGPAPSTRDTRRRDARAHPRHATSR